jgi:transcriptional regulator GlxA family with amidase domain
MTDMTLAPITFGVLVFDGVEVLDACGPFEVFSTAGRLARTTDDLALLRVATVARTSEPVVGRGGLRLIPDHTIDDDTRFDVLVVPGGVTGAVERNDLVLEWLVRRHRTSRLTLGICNGAFLLAAAGLLDGRPVTTHWADEDELEQRWPAVHVKREPRWVDDGDIITSAGISAGIDASLHVVRRLVGAEVAVRTARQMEYDWIQAP